MKETIWRLVTSYLCRCVNLHRSWRAPICMGEGDTGVGICMGEGDGGVGTYIYVWVKEMEP